MEKIVEDGWGWRHEDADGPNAPSHMRASLMSPEVLVPLDDGQARARALPGDLLLRVRRAARPQGLRDLASLNAEHGVFT